MYSGVPNVVESVIRKILVLIGDADTVGINTKYVVHSPDAAMKLAIRFV